MSSLSPELLALIDKALNSPENITLGELEILLETAIDALKSVQDLAPPSPERKDLDNKMEELISKKAQLHITSIVAGSAIYKSCVIDLSKATEVAVQAKSDITSTASIIANVAKAVEATAKILEVLIKLLA